MLSRRSGMENFHSFSHNVGQSMLQQEVLTEVLLHPSLVDISSPSRVYPLARRAFFFYSSFRPRAKVDYTSYSYLGVFAVGRQIFTCLILILLRARSFVSLCLHAALLPPPVPSFSARKGGPGEGYTGAAFPSSLPLAFLFLNLCPSGLADAGQYVPMHV